LALSAGLVCPAPGPWQRPDPGR